MRSFAAPRTTRRAVLAAALAAPFAAQTETAWPTKPVRIVVPFYPGGAINALVRVIGDALTAGLGQQVLVDPRPGANTIVGSEIVAKAAPDGYTFLITTNSTHTSNPSLYAILPFDPAKDLIPVSLVSLGTHPDRGQGRCAVQRPRGHGGVGERPGPARELRAGTPAGIVGRMQREIKAAIAEPALAEKLIAQGQVE